VSIKPLPLIFLLFAATAASAPPLAKLEPVVVTATLRPVPAYKISGVVDGLPQGASRTS
jgi:hypothetical protein